MSQTNKTKAPEVGQAMTDAERQRKCRAKKKALYGIIPYSCEIHQDDKPALDAFIEKLKAERNA